MEEKQEWERPPFEKSRQYQAFCACMDMGPARSLQRIVQEHNKSIAILGKWNSGWDWMRRAEAYDDHLEAMRRIEMEQERQEKQFLLAKHLLHQSSPPDAVKEYGKEKAPDPIDDPVNLETVVDENSYVVEADDPAQQARLNGDLPVPHSHVADCVFAVNPIFPYGAVRGDVRDRPQTDCGKQKLK